MIATEALTPLDNVSNEGTFYLPGFNHGLNQSLGMRTSD